MTGRKLLFSLLAVSCSLAIVISILLAKRQVQQQSTTQALSTQPAPRGISFEATVPAAKSSTVAPAPNHASQVEPDRSSSSTQPEPRAAFLYFSANTLGENYGKLAMARMDALSQRSYSPELRCERVHFSHGTGVCLTADRGVFTSYYAIKFDEAMRRGWTIKLNGFPSRVRVSPSGRLAAITVFLTGHSYMSLNFSTQTTILNTATGNVIADLEQFSVIRDNQEFKSPDFNFWGVTFSSDENLFYATLWSKAKTYLVEGNLAKRTAKVIHEGVECPSLSPDNTRIAFKKRVEGDHIAWRISVLNLQNGKEIRLGESRSVDDQLEWLDNSHVLYALSQGDATASSASTDIWALPATADGSPQLLLTGAFSPAVARSPQLIRRSVLRFKGNRNHTARAR